MTTADVRVRRPKDKELLIQSLREEAGFSTMRDVLIFAAALGLSRNRRTPFEGSGEPIRYDVLVDRAWAGQLVDMLGVHDVPSDAEVLSASRLGDRVRVFEEYANGGLEFLQGEVNRLREPLEVVCASLVSDALTAGGSSNLPTPEELIHELEW